MREQPRVFATHAPSGAAGVALRERCEVESWPGPGPPPRQELAARLAEAEGLLCLLTDSVDAALLARAPRLRAISTVSVGVDHVDLEAATARGIPVGHTPGVLTETTADLAFALLLASARRVAEADRWVRSGGWTRVWEPDLLLGADLHGATLGIVGLGAIGRAVARRARGFDMEVLAWSRRRHPLGDLEGHVAWAELPDLLRRSDFVSVHVALTHETRGLVDAAALAVMKPGAFLVNTARGGVIAEEALVAALRSGRLGGAGLDVFASEPLDPQSPLLTLPNVVVTPHIGSASQATRARMAALAVENLLAGLAGARMRHCANPSVYEAPVPDARGRSKADS
jgi:glyoxylate reductase